MSKIIFTRPEDGGVSVVAPADTADLSALIPKAVPNGVEFEIVDSESTFPADRLFREAWTWAGIGNPVLEDLDKSKAIACEQVKNATRAEIKVVMEAELLGDPVTKTAEQLRTACSGVIEQINSASTPYEAKVLMCSYCELPAPQQSSPPN